MLPLGLVVLPEQPHIGIVVHPLWPLGERLHHVGTAPETFPDLLCAPQGPVLLILALALVAEVVAVPAQEILPRPVQDRHSPAALRPGTDEPGTLSPEVAQCPLQWYRLLNFLPLPNWPTAVAVGEDYLILVDESTDGSHLLPG